MPAYVIVQVHVTDPGRFLEYLRETPRVMEKFGGRYLARGGDTVAFEGTSSGERVVLIEFPSLASAQEWYASPEYAAIKPLREGAATASMIAVDGHDPERPAVCPSAHVFAGEEQMRSAPRTGLSASQVRLELSKCIVRSWSPDDKAALVRAANNRQVWRNLTHTFPHPYTDDDADDWFALLAETDEPTHWAIEVDGQTSGGISIEIGEGVFCRKADFGYWLAEPCWGRGIMTEAAQAVVAYAMPRYNLCRLEASVFAWNPASMRVLEHCGFVREGVRRAAVFKDGQLIDEVDYALVREGAGHDQRENGPLAT